MTNDPDYSAHVRAFHILNNKENKLRCPERLTEYYRWLESQERMPETPNFILSQTERASVSIWRKAR